MFWIAIPRIFNLRQCQYKCHISYNKGDFATQSHNLRKITCKEKRLANSPKWWQVETEMKETWMRLEGSERTRDAYMPSIPILKALAKSRKGYKTWHLLKYD